MSIIEKKLEELFELADSLKDRIYSIYISTDSPLEEEFYNLSPIINNKEYLKWERNTYKKIVSLLSREEFDKSIIFLIDIKKDYLKSTLKTLSRDNVGTALNIVNFVYEDIEIELLRQKKKSVNADVTAFLKEMSDVSRKYGIHIDQHHGGWYAPYLVNKEGYTVANDLGWCEKDGYDVEILEEEEWEKWS